MYTSSATIRGLRSFIRKLYLLGLIEINLHALIPSLDSAEDGILCPCRNRIKIEANSVEAFQSASNESICAMQFRLTLQHNSYQVELRAGVTNSYKYTTKLLHHGVCTFSSGTKKVLVAVTQSIFLVRV